MGHTNHTVTLYSAQSDTVVGILESEGRCFSKKEYVVQKYGESAPIFVAAYSWFAAEAQKYLAKPAGAEYPYWAFADLYSATPTTDGRILQLRVPTDEAVFFDLYDWNRILQLKFLGETEAEEERFRRTLLEIGVRRETDVMLTNFYPDLKRQVQQSWQRLFRHHEDIKAGNTAGVKSVQAGLWQLKREWMV